jgi:hypothetical protein
MTQEVIEPLTQDERTILEIASHGEFMIETGRWHDPIMSLVKKGYMEGPQFNRYITEAGRKAVGASDADEDRNLAAYVDKFRDMEIGRSEIAAAITSMVDPWVALVRKSVGLSGKATSYDLDRWLEVLRKQVAAKLAEEN